MLSPLPKRLAVAALLSVAAYGSAHGQAEPIKFGKLDSKELDNKNFVADSAAEAVVLCDYGRSRFDVGDDGFRVVFDRVTRIKILKKSGYQWATVRVPLYKKNSSEEKLVGLRGYTYNFVNGEVVKDKLESAAVFTEQLTTNNFVRKFTLPNVREGSVIEFAYTVTSDFTFNFQDWQFQYEIPVRWSEYRASIPEYFDYKQLMQGYEPLAVQERTEASTQYTVRWSSEITPGLSGGRTSGGSGTLTPRVTNYRWAMKDVPAFVEEPYMTTAKDYMARIDFELAGVKWPDQPYKSVADSWDKINSDLLSSENFGTQLKRGGFLKEEIAALTKQHTDPAARAAAVQALVEKSIKYNGQDWIYTTGTLRHAYDQHRGNAAEVNLLLVALLREAGLQANPVLLSTRDHGQINTSFPLLSKFNYVVAHVTLPENKELLVDATDPLVPAGMLPERCLSNMARLIMPDAAQSRWLDLTASNKRFQQYRQVQLTVDERGGSTGKVHHEHGEYAGVYLRGKLNKQGEKKYMEELTKAYEGGSIPKYTFKERETVSKPLALDYDFVLPGADAPVGTIYLNPQRYLGQQQNPFRHETRRFPVDYGAQLDETLMLTINLPAGFEPEELPKSAAVELPDGGGRFLYNVVVNGSSIQIVSRMNLRKPVYLAEEYAYLREFYSRMLAKHAEQIVLKKKS